MMMCLESLAGAGRKNRRTDNGNDNDNENNNGTFSHEMIRQYSRLPHTTI